MSGRKDGPSGKPMLHFVQCKSKSAAEDAARSAGKGITCRLSFMIN